MLRTLVLDHRGVPARTTSWQEAITKTINGTLLTEIPYPGRVARSMSLTVPIPAVARQINTTPAERFALEPTRRNILARDGHECAYCGLRPHWDELEILTIDHIVPQCRARNGKVQVPWMERMVGVHSWHNVITACAPCNWKKGDRTPDEVSMPLRFFPAAPNLLNRGRILVYRYLSPPDVWKPFAEPDLNTLCDLILI